MIKTIAAIFLLLIVGLLMYACNPYVSWKEEVKLNDGRVIVVQQKRRFYGHLTREAWLTIDLPDISSESMVWHENLTPMIVNVHEGRLYVVGWPDSNMESREYGYPAPPYIGFIWNKDTFVRIPFKEIPTQIYTTNMLMADYPSTGLSLLDLQRKNSSELNGDWRLHFYWKMDPNMDCMCSKPDEN